MNAETVLQTLEAGLRPVIEAAGGRLEMASDPSHVIEILGGSDPRGWRAILGYAGEAAYEDELAPGIRDLSISLTVQAARGYHIRPGRHLFRPTPAGRDSLIHLSDDLDRIFRGFTGEVHGDVDCHGFRFTSRNWLEAEGLPTRQLTTLYNLRIGNDLPGPADAVALHWPVPA